jgi:hypothetical protein
MGLSLQQVKEILANISSAPSGIQMSSKNGDIKFEAEECLAGENESIRGFLIRCSFWRPDTNTGKMGTGYGRYIHTPEDSDEKQIVMTAYVCYNLIVEHEKLEAFLYKNHRLFNPHKTLEQLYYPETNE